MEANAILLAGGRSSRMGTNKALLSYNGTTLLQFGYEKLQAVLGGTGKVVVSGDYPHFPCVSDEVTDRGPIEGIWTCTRKMQPGTAFLVVPVDMPFLEVSALKDMLNRLKSDGSLECVYFEHFELPFAFNYNQRTDEILKRIRNSSEPENRSLRQFKRQLNGKLLQSTKSEYFQNMNTPEEWMACQ